MPPALTSVFPIKPIFLSDPTELTKAAPILPGFLTNLVYRATLTAFGLIGYAYILRNQIKEVRDDLGGQIKEMNGDLKELKHDIKGLTTVRQRWSFMICLLH